MSNNSQQAEAVPPFAPPPGYATDERTCGEMSCDECNDRAAWLRAELAETRRKWFGCQGELSALRELIAEARAWGIRSDAYDAIRARGNAEAADKMLGQSHNKGMGDENGGYQPPGHANRQEGAR